jgi:hypothetical protein
MVRKVEVDHETYLRLTFAANLTNSTPGGVLAGLVDAMISEAVQSTTDTTPSPPPVLVFADYAGHQTHGHYDTITTRIDITSGPLAGRSFKTPSGAARAVISHYNPAVIPIRTGWLFWVLADGTRRRLQSIRPPHRTRTRTATTSPTAAPSTSPVQPPTC